MDTTWVCTNANDMMDQGSSEDVYILFALYIKLSLGQKEKNKKEPATSEQQA